MIHDPDEIPIRIMQNSLSDEILIYIPASVWDVENLAEEIRRAVLIAAAEPSDGLDS